MLFCRCTQKYCMPTSIACPLLGSVMSYSTTRKWRKSSCSSLKKRRKSRNTKRSETSLRPPQRGTDASDIASRNDHKNHHSQCLDALPVSSVEEQKQLIDDSVADRPPFSYHSSSENWSPTVSDYRALVEDLLVYRHESLKPVLSALRKERMLFDKSVKRMEERVTEMYLVRDEIREMLRESASLQRHKVVEALRTIGGCTTVIEEGGEKEEEEEEEEDEKEIIL